MEFAFSIKIPSVCKQPWEESGLLAWPLCAEFQLGEFAVLQRGQTSKVLLSTRSSFWSEENSQAGGSFGCPGSAGSGPKPNCF